MSTVQLPKKLLNFIWYFIKKQKVYFVIIQILAFAWSIDNTVWPFILKILINKIMAFTGEKGELWYYLMPILIFWAITWILIELAYTLRESFCP